MGGSASGGVSNSESKPLSAMERSAIYQGAMRDLSNTNPGYIQNGMLTGPQYESPTYQSAGGDYNTLQKSMTEGYTAPLDSAKAQDVTNFNNSAGAKGIWSSGLALKGEQDINKGYAPQYAKAGADATNAAFGLKQQDANAQNTFNLQNATASNQSKWKPLDYLAGIWNGTGGQNSSASSVNASGGFTI